MHNIILIALQVMCSILHWNQLLLIVKFKDTTLENVIYFEQSKLSMTKPYSGVQQIPLARSIWGVTGDPASIIPGHQISLHQKQDFAKPKSSKTLAQKSPELKECNYTWELIWQKSGSPKMNVLSIKFGHTKKIIHDIILSSHFPQRCLISKHFNLFPICHNFPKDKYGRHIGHPRREKV